MFCIEHFQLKLTVSIPAAARRFCRKEAKEEEAEEEEEEAAFTRIDAEAPFAPS